MTIPDYQALMLPILRRAATSEIRIPEIEQSLADEFSLSEEERGKLLPSGKQRVLSNRAHWAKFYLTKAGLLAAKSHRRFTVTDAGRDLLASEPNNITVQTLQKYPPFVTFYQGGQNENAASTPESAPVSPAASAAISEITPEEQIEAASVALRSALRTDLLQRIMDNSPSFFEGLIVSLLVAMGYGGSHRDAAAQLGKSGDGGVDGVINEDRLGLDRVYVQAKRYADGNTVSRPEVQSFVGSLVGLGATKGVFVTTSGFSGQALDFVKRLPQRVILIDGQQLAELMIEHNVGVRLSRAVEFKRIDEDFFAEEE